MAPTSCFCLKDKATTKSPEGLILWIANHCLHVTLTQYWIKSSDSHNEQLSTLSAHAAMKSHWWIVVCSMRLFHKLGGYPWHCLDWKVSYPQLRSMQYLIHDFYGAHMNVPAYFPATHHTPGLLATQLKTIEEFLLTVAVSLRRALCVRSGVLLLSTNGPSLGKPDPVR